MKLTLKSLELIYHGTLVMIRFPAYYEWCTAWDIYIEDYKKFTKKVG